MESRYYFNEYVLIWQYVHLSEVRTKYYSRQALQAMVWLGLRYNLLCLASNEHPKSTVQCTMYIADLVGLERHTTTVEGVVNDVLSSRAKAHCRSNDFRGVPSDFNFWKVTCIALHEGGIS